MLCLGFTDLKEGVQMEDVIKTIIALDESARRKVDEVKNRRVLASQDIDEQRRRLKEEYDVKVEKAVNAEREKREREEKKALAVFDGNNEEISARLLKQYAENEERWVEELVKRVIEE